MLIGMMWLFLLIAAALVPGMVSGQAVVDLLPNLAPLPASDLKLQTVDTTTLLRFSTTSWNSGSGPLELRGAEIIDNKENVYQRIYRSDSTFYDRLAGSFVWHPQHGHFHFDDYALYTLSKVGSPGASDRISSKTTFCIIDTTRIDTKLPGAPNRAVYGGCSKLQGMSVGWGDTYKYYLFGQSIDVTGLEDGEYVLTITVDPKGRLAEANTGDNVSSVNLLLQNGRVCNLSSQGNRCH